MKELEEKAKKICDLKDSLMCQVKPYIDCDLFCSDVDGMAVGQVVDMIKDLCDAEKNLFKGAYYKSVVKAMKEAEEEQEMMRKMGMCEPMGYGPDRRSMHMGYDAWRYPSSGRFAPTGSGQHYGYMPQEMRDRWPDFNDPVMGNEEMLQEGMGMLGYNGGSGSRSSNGNSQNGSNNNSDMSSYGRSRSGRYGYPMNDRYGMPYNEYEDAKRYYHESKDPEAKKEMAEHAKHHLKDVIETTEDIWDDAKPEAKKEFKEHMMKLLKDIPMN